MRDDYWVLIIVQIWRHFSLPIAMAVTSLKVPRMTLLKRRTPTKRKMGLPSILSEKEADSSSNKLSASR